MAINKELKTKTNQELIVEIAKAKKDLIMKKLEYKMGKSKNITELRELKKSIAKMFTLVNNKNQNAE